ncbi:MAG: nucleotidyl transferase AbiEii/AbiGii toxin family protein [Fibrobacterota bacterium]|nr:nucleotidyl transferase AbiEii/AbiGii toxin family protein [Fibrobacterota bacterium]
MEKDFWVCWILGQIFSDPELEPHFIFKGGTSLSKVYKVIDRFSEDVDLGIHPGTLGISEDAFTALESRTSRTGALLDMQKACGERLEKNIVPRLELNVHLALSGPGYGKSGLTYEFDERVHGLHAEHHRPEGHDMPVRHARHYADFTRLLAHPRANIFLADTAMCLRVAEWKNRVFSRKWARYELARPGSFSLVPPEAHLKNLEKDYVAMRPMFLTEPQPFDDLIRALSDAERRLNAI